MIKVGLTGGIGSGKSTICQFFRIIGIPVFEADVEAKRIINSSSIVRSKLMLNFGNDIYLSNQSLDRKKLANIVFNSAPSLEKLNAIVHPEVRKYFFEWVGKQQAPYVLHEAAILFESGFYEMMDFNILVTAPEEERILRVKTRDNISEEEVRQRIGKQWIDEEKMKFSDLVLQNDNKDLLIPQLIEFDKKIRKDG
ncbi:dephospho-CoA kinase [Sunxiuqinia sp. A32]|uniref:dephospho-CoA kinase n=1 Tax=Sunxiuqinia sp. A32 TaxID=3461496 RepID=UPI0040456610